MLYNERYTGLYIYDRLAAKGVNGRNGHEFKNEDEMIRIEGGMPQIVDKHTLETVQKTMIQNRKRNGRFRMKHPVLLTGLIECECGYSYTSCYRKERPGHKPYSSYHCGYNSSHKNGRCDNLGVEQTTLDDAVLDLLYQNFYEDIPTITKTLNEYRQQKIQALGADLQTLKKQITANEIKVKNIVEAIAQGVSNSAMVDRIRELDKEREQLEAKLDEASRIEETAEISEEEIRSILENSKEFVRKKNIPEVQRFIHKYIHKVVVHKETVKVTFNVAFSFCGKNSATYQFTRDLNREKLKDRQYQIRKAV